MPHLFHGGRIVSHDPAVGEPQVLVVENGRIVAVGDREVLPRLSGRDRGRPRRPHSVAGLHRRAQPSLDRRAASTVGRRRGRGAISTGCGRCCAIQAAREPQAHWVRACLWDESRAGLFLDRHALDALGLDRPVIVAHYTLHQCVVNTQGLDELGIGRHTPDPPGGLIARGADGAADGVLIERAWSEAHARSVAAYRRSRPLGRSVRGAHAPAPARRHHRRARRGLLAGGGSGVCARCGARVA